MSDPILKPWMLAATFGAPPTQTLRQAVFLAPNAETAIMMFVSASHVVHGEKELCTSISCDEVRADIIEAARRGMVGPAPVLSVVPHDLAKAGDDIKAAMRDPNYWNAMRPKPSAPDSDLPPAG